MRKIDTLVIHHTATPNERDETVAAIRRYHTHIRGYSDIGYHAVITRDGVIHTGRPLEQVGAHVKGHNRGSIGVAMVGTGFFTRAQWRALAEVVAWFRACVPDGRIVGHRNLVPTDCPGFSVAAWLKNPGAIAAQYLWEDLA